MDIQLHSATNFNYLLSRDCHLKNELINLYKIIQEELSSCMDSTRKQMLVVYSELIERYADRLNHLSLNLKRQTIETEYFAEPSYECDEQESNILVRFTDDVRIIKNSLMRYLNRHRTK